MLRTGVLIAVWVPLVLLAGCERPGSALQIDLAGLVGAASELDGRLVETIGVVRMFPDPEHVWIEDARLQRVGLEPIATGLSYLGQTVRVRGRFRLDPEQGRQIALTHIEAVTATGAQEFGD